MWWSMLAITYAGAPIFRVPVSQPPLNLARVLFIKVNFDFDQVLVGQLIGFEIRLDGRVDIAIHVQDRPTELAESANATKLYPALSFKHCLLALALVLARLDASRRSK